MKEILTLERDRWWSNTGQCSGDYQHWKSVTAWFPPHHNTWRSQHCTGLDCDVDWLQCQSGIVMLISLTSLTVSLPPHTSQPHSHWSGQTVPLLLTERNLNTNYISHLQQSTRRTVHKLGIRTFPRIFHLIHKTHTHPQNLGIPIHYLFYSKVYLFSKLCLQYNITQTLFRWSNPDSEVCGVTEKFLFTEDPTKNVSEISQCDSKRAKNCRALKLNPEYLTIKPSTLKSQFLTLLPGRLLNSYQGCQDLSQCLNEIRAQYLTYTYSDQTRVEKSAVRLPEDGGVEWPNWPEHEDNQLSLQVGWRGGGGSQYLTVRWLLGKQHDGLRAL